MIKLCKCGHERASHAISLTGEVGGCMHTILKGWIYCECGEYEPQEEDAKGNGLKKMKAFYVYSVDDDEKCLLVYANNRNQARKVGLDALPWFGTEYISMHALRVPDYDKFANSNIPYVIYSNSDLPQDAKPFYTEWKTDDPIRATY